MSSNRQALSALMNSASAKKDSGATVVGQRKASFRELRPADAPGRPHPQAQTGNRLPDAVRGKMESAFQMDFSRIRVFPDSPVAPGIGALAYTRGEEVHFASGQYNPESRRGLELIGHELAHAVQQSQGRVRPNGKISGHAVNSDPRLESEADAAGVQAAQADTVKIEHGGPQLGATKAASPEEGVAQLEEDPQKTPPPIEEVLAKAKAERETRHDREANLAKSSRGLQAGLKRPLQSKRLRQIGPNIFGMECNTVSVLYVLQSYGLIPAEMTLEEFQDAFTPVESALDYLDYGDQTINTHVTNAIRVGGKEIHDLAGNTIPGQDMFSSIISKAKTEHDRQVETNIKMRGITRLNKVKVDAAIPEAPPHADPVETQRLLLKILKAFKALTEQERYKPLRNTNIPNGPSLINSKSEMVDQTAAMNSGTLREAYFRAGHTIRAGINEHSQTSGVTHWVTIVNYIGKCDINGKNYHIYLPDDPFFDNPYVIAPTIHLRETKAKINGKPFDIKKTVLGDFVFAESSPDDPPGLFDKSYRILQLTGHAIGVKYSKSR